MNCIFRINFFLQKINFSTDKKFNGCEKRPLCLGEIFKHDVQGDSASFHNTWLEGSSILDYQKSLCAHRTYYLSAFVEEWTVSKVCRSSKAEFFFLKNMENLTMPYVSTPHLMQKFVCAYFAYINYWKGWKTLKIQIFHYFANTQFLNLLRSLNNGCK